MHKAIRVISDFKQRVSLFLLRRSAFLFCNTERIAKSLELQEETGRTYITSYLSSPEQEAKFNEEFDKRFFRRKKKNDGIKIVNKQSPTGW